MSGTGTIDNPFDLATALTSGRVGAGDTLLLRGGTYAGDFTASISGTPAQRIEIKPYPGESPVIDGSLTIIGQQLTVNGIEVKNTSWVDRISAEAGSSPADITQKFGISVHNIGNKVINCKVHNAKIGIYIDDAADDFELYGCTFWDNGWIGPDESHGHTIYFHGKNLLRTVSNCISMQDFSDIGLHIYNANSIINHLIENNIHATRRVVIGSNYGNTQNIAVRNNCFYGETFRAGYTVEAKTNSGLSVIGNYIAQNLGLYGFQDAALTGNVFELGVDLSIEYPGSYTPYTLDNTFSESGADRVVIYPNKYDNGRASLAIYNYSLAESVTVDLSALPLTVGRTYKLCQAQNPLVDIVTFVYNGSPISVDMQAASHSMSIPIGHNVALEGTTFPRFGAFIIEPE